MSAESYAELRKWYARVQATPELALALKHRHKMPEDLAVQWKAAAPGDDDNEKELALVFALYQIADTLEAVNVLMANMQASAAHVVPASHVDPAPIPLEALGTEPPPAEK